LGDVVELLGDLVDELGAFVVLVLPLLPANSRNGLGSEPRRTLY
jgi:hypothetical protein